MVDGKIGNNNISPGRTGETKRRPSPSQSIAANYPVQTLYPHSLCRFVIGFKRQATRITMIEGKTGSAPDDLMGRTSINRSSPRDRYMHAMQGCHFIGDGAEQPVIN